ncbi:hypothetical protein HYC85_023983 [Camellia sinensis]|uniref:Uncharacterized protein n=1 Tax=Camellia sinensis TaxID=4442 RepID=A0A7J7GJU4_CAMSI|nr:hypothetical protein HYC85_023983 [Camellia sinensis]
MTPNEEDDGNKNAPNHKFPGSKDSHRRSTTFLKADAGRIGTTLDFQNRAKHPTYNQERSSREKEEEFLSENRSSKLDLRGLNRWILVLGCKDECHYIGSMHCSYGPLLTSSPESLLTHCCHYRDSASSGTNNYICLRLNNLSLSHIGSIEKLLWVQMLDLSHNQLSSIEGLQAMQLLSCLNLSNNKMGSFSALEPLKLLKSLKVLDIPYNEIGAHAVDTRRKHRGTIINLLNSVS